MIAFGNPSILPFGVRAMGSTPIGEICEPCSEPITFGDSGFLLPDALARKLIPFHQECFVWITVGTAAHQMGLCDCRGRQMFPIKKQTRREQARRALAVALATPDGPVSIN
jgi:hypothetical protein